MSENMGKAYAFFYCNAVKEAIEAELPEIRRLVETPSELELSLIEGMKNVTGDERLMDIAREAEEAGINYMLQASYPNRTNRTTSDEVASVVNQMYQSSLYSEGDPFNGEIVYKEEGEYIYRE